MSRPGHLSNRALGVSLTVGFGIVVAYLLTRPLWPPELRVPGTLAQQLVGTAGAALLLAPTWFAFVKRAGRMRSAPRWVSLHALAALAGTVLAFIHGAGDFTAAPALLLLCLVALMGLGLWARTRGASRMADTFGTKGRGFAQPSAQTRAALKRVLEAKTRVLGDLDPTASEATFAPTLSHWLRKPGLSRRYQNLAAEERRLMEQRSTVHPWQAWWRILHLALAALFLIGLLVHVATALFFAGWVAEGREITWWHITAW